VSANLERMAIGLASAPTKLLRTGCAKNATRRGGQEKRIRMAIPDRETCDEKQAVRSPDQRLSMALTMKSRRVVSGD
jgi:hypothetical protein